MKTEYTLQDRISLIKYQIKRAVKMEDYRTAAALKNNLEELKNQNEEIHCQS
jgi:protein-arginine kinase activator protein McsA